MTLTVTQCQKVMRNWNLCGHSVVKWPGVARTVVMVDYVRDMITQVSCK